MTVGLYPVSAAPVSGALASGGGGTAPDVVVSLALSVSVVAPAPTVVTLSLPLVVVAPATVSLPLSVAVIDAAVTGGLDGAGTWAAAPDGRWQPVVILDGLDISARLTGPVSVQSADNAARTADLAFLPSSVLQPLALIGRPLRIAFAQAGGANAQTIFSGVVERPSIDANTGIISITAHDQAQEIWSRTARGTIDALVGGRWHAAFGEPADNYEYLRARIESVGASWALDALQQPRVVPWRDLPRSVTVRQADIIDGSVSVDLPSRDALRTRITCRLQYRYTRLRWRGASAQYSQSLGFYVSVVGGEVVGKEWLTRSMVMSAIEGATDWEQVGDVVIENPMPQVIEPPGGIGGLGGGYVITAQTAPELVLSFRANFATRWQQSATEDYTVTVVWPAMETQLGAPVEEEIGATLEADFDSPSWNIDPTVLPINGTIYLGDIIQAWQPAGADAAARDEVLRTLLDRAWVRLWASSRTGRVTFALPCRPDIWLDTWVTLYAQHVTAAGKVIEVEHLLDPTSGEAITNVTLAIGMPGGAAASHPVWALPAAPADPYTPPVDAWSFEAGTYVGGELLSPEFDEATMIGLCTNIDDASLTDLERNARNWYPLQFAMRAPTLADADRDPLELPATAQIDVTVPTDTLEIT